MEQRLDNGYIIDTNNMPDYYSPVCCFRCGCRVGWLDGSISDEPILICDDCASTITPTGFDDE